MRALSALGSPLAAKPRVSTSLLPLEGAAAQAAIGESLRALKVPETLLPVPSAEAKPLSVVRDTLGFTHVRVGFELEGLPVFGAQVIVHLDARGAVSDVTGEPPLLAAPLPAFLVSADQAMQRARAQWTNGGLPPASLGASEEVVMVDEAGTPRRVHRVELDASPRQGEVWVDATTGEVLALHETDAGYLSSGDEALASEAAVTESADAPPSEPTGTGASLYSGTVPLFTTRQSDGRFSLEDASRNGSRTVAQSSSPSGRPILDDDNVWGEAGDGADQRGAIDAHYAMQMTWDFYRDVLGRNGIDDRGTALVSIVHTSQKNNATFQDGAMRYGDGDGTRFGPFAALDVGGHELTHGVTKLTAGLYNFGESGALNESFSDILGTGVEWYASQRNPAVKFDWWGGEDIFTPGKEGDALRYLDNPARVRGTPDHFSKYSVAMDDHLGAAVSNHAFYLLTEGGTNRTSGLSVAEGIGMEKALRIFYRALTVYLRPSDTFAAARKATLKAAEDLFGKDSVEAKRVDEAWAAVGVKPRAPRPAPAAPAAR
jgi:Zn-dependent metalloprotease